MRLGLMPMAYAFWPLSLKSPGHPPPVVAKAPEAGCTALR
jgi:hypothetical protein